MSALGELGSADEITKHSMCAALATAPRSVMTEAASALKRLFPPGMWSDGLDSLDLDLVGTLALLGWLSSPSPTIKSIVLAAPLCHRGSCLGRLRPGPDTRNTLEEATLPSSKLSKCPQTPPNAPRPVLMHPCILSLQSLRLQSDVFVDRFCLPPHASLSLRESLLIRTMEGNNRTLVQTDRPPPPSPLSPRLFLC